MHADLTVWAPRSIQSKSCNVRLSVCLCVPSVGDQNQENWRLLGSLKLQKYEHLFLSFFFNWFLIFLNFWLVLSWWESLLCIVGALAGLGSVAVTADIGDQWQVTCDMWHVTHDKCHSIFFLFFYFFNWGGRGWYLFVEEYFWYLCYYFHTSRYSGSPTQLFKHHDKF